MRRGHMVLPPNNHANQKCEWVCVNVISLFSFIFLPYPWRPCQRLLLRGAAQLRCDLVARHPWAPWSQAISTYTERGWHAHHVAKREEITQEDIKIREKKRSVNLEMSSKQRWWVCVCQECKPHVSTEGAWEKKVYMCARSANYM